MRSVRGRLLVGALAVVLGVGGLSPTASASAEELASGDRMQPGQVLEPNTAVTSSGGAYQLTMQSDGNLVLTTGGSPVWFSSTYGATAARLVMQPDGNLVVRDTAGTPIWHTSTFGNPGAYLVVQPDSNLVVYRADGSPIWAIWGLPSSPAAPPAVPGPPPDSAPAPQPDPNEYDPEDDDPADLGQYSLYGLRAQAAGASGVSAEAAAICRGEGRYVIDVRADYGRITLRSKDRGGLMVGAAHDGDCFEYVSEGGGWILGRVRPTSRHGAICGYLLRNAGGRDRLTGGQGRVDSAGSCDSRADAGRPVYAVVGPFSGRGHLVWHRNQSGTFSRLAGGVQQVDTNERLRNDASCRPHHNLNGADRLEDPFDDAAIAAIEPDRRPGFRYRTRKGGGAGDNAVVQIPLSGGRTVWGIVPLSCLPSARPLRPSELLYCPSRRGDTPAVDPDKDRSRCLRPRSDGREWFSRPAPF